MHKVNKYFEIYWAVNWKLNQNRFYLHTEGNKKKKVILRWKRVKVSFEEDKVSSQLMKKLSKHIPHR
jgi:hypothetical protein